LRIKVTDEFGRALSGAQANPTVMTLGNGITTTTNFDAAESDKQGIAILRIPAEIDVDGETSTPVRVVGTVKRIGYTMNVFRQELGNAKALVVLAKETSLQVSAVDANSQPLGDFGLVMTGDDTDYRRSKLIAELDPQGNAVVLGMGMGPRQALLVCPRKDGRHLFSSVQSLNFADAQDIRLRSVPLKVGKSLRGRISGIAQRPIEGGFVVVCCQLKSRRQIPVQQRLHWFDATTIKPDGSYRFESLPDCETIQLAATCQGAAMRIDGRDGNTHIGIEFSPQWTANPGARNQGVAAATHDIEMVATCSAIVRVVDRDGKPVPGAGVRVWPPVIWKNGVGLMGLSPLRTVADLAMMPGINNPALRKFEWDNQDRSGITDDDGQLRLTGLARDHPLRLLAQSPGSKQVATESKTIDHDNQEIEVIVDR
jgi:hypothetical protein